MLTFEKDTKIRVMNEFQEWLQEQLNLRNWSASDLATRAGVGPSTITRILTGERGAGADVCTKIALALGVEEDEVFRIAGLLPRKKESLNGLSDLQKEMLGLMNQLDETGQRMAVEVVKGLVSRASRR